MATAADFPTTVLAARAEAQWVPAEVVRPPSQVPNRIDRACIGRSTNATTAIDASSATMAREGPRQRGSSSRPPSRSASHPIDESFIFEAFREVSDRPSDPQQPSCMLLHYVPPPFVCECNASKNWHAACEPLAACQKWSGTSGVICRASI
mmetsp:Transcript_37963/g.82202  ORF Transcript_37963/g.82202 Transcript_37963/m.82202 type:complete len:151 (+) Transcript_37963:704-1156(+)